jgi:signal transduction histidine kinase
MRERAASRGGELDLESQPGQGTTVRVRQPVRVGEA